MSSLSLSRIPRRFQVLLVAVLLLAVLWVAVLHKLVNSSSGSSEPVSAPASHPPAALAPSHRAAPKPAKPRAAVASKPVAPTTVKPHQAVAPAPSHLGSTAARAHHAVTVPRHATTSVHPRTLLPSQRPKPRIAPKTPAAKAGLPLPVRRIEEALGEGKVALVLFWDPENPTDRFVAGELQALARRQPRAVSVQLATPAEIGSFAPFTQKALISETPTVMVVGPNRNVSLLPGFVEGQALERAVALARRAGSVAR